MHIHPSSPDSSLFLEPEESAAIKIQAGFRGYRVRKNLHNSQQQSRKPKVNGYIASRHHHHHHHHHHQQTRNNQRGAGMEQATSNKTNASASIASVPHSPTGSDVTAGDDDEVQQKCATKIQAGVRGFLVRKKQKLAADAATKIQAGFRGFKARKDVQKLKQK